MWPLVRVYCCLLLFCFSVSAQQSQQLYVKNYAEKDGLSSNYIRCFFQDSKGFMWIGTSYGLNRFDGQKFEKFYADAGNPHSISSNVITAIIEDRQGHIWVGTENAGLNKFNDDTKTFSPYRYMANNEQALKEDFVNSLYADSKGSIWIGYASKGWSVLNPVTNSLAHYASGQTFINRWGKNASDCVGGFTEDSKGNMWLAGGYGLFMQDAQTKKLTVYIDDNSSFYKENQNLFMTVQYYGDSLLWLGTWACGLKQFNINTKKFTAYLLQPNNPYAGNRNIVDKIAKKSANELWIASLDKGLGVFNITTNQFQFFEHKSDNKNSPPPKECRRIFVDNNQTLWAGYDYGFSLIAPSNQNIKTTAVPPIKSSFFTESTVHSFYYHAPTNKLYFGLDVGNGLYEKDISNNTIKLLPTKGLPVTTSGSHHVADIFKWDGQNLLTNIDGGFYLYNIYSNSFSRLLLKHNNTTIEMHGSASQLDAKNELWIIDYNKRYYKIKLGNNNVQQVGGVAANQAFPFIAGSFIVTSFNDSLAWVFDRSRGLVLFNTINNTSNADFYEKNLYKIGDPKKIVMDKQDHYWFTTYNEGLFEMWQTSNGKYSYKRYTEKEGLPDMFLNEIFCDSLGFIWISSKKGIIRFHPSKPVFKNYNDDNGLPETLYAIESGYLGSNQIVYFGCINHFIEIDTRHVVENRMPPKVMLRYLNIFDKSWSDSLNINNQQKIELSYKQNFISFEFAALSFVNGNQCQYAYQLQGLDKDWIYCGNRQYASYSGLKPGKYLLRIKAANSDGVWNEQGISLQIIIHAPFWQTAWFYVLLSIILIVIVVGLYRYRIAAIRKEEQIKTDYNKKVAEIEMKALRAQMNPHFIFNCLNSINRYIVKSDHVTASGYLTRFAKLIRLILDSSATETTSLESEIQLLQLYIEMEMLRFDNRFAVQFQVTPSINQSTSFIPSMLIQPYIENAIWHGLLHKEGKGNLKLLFTEQSKDLLRVVIEDDGVGRQKAAEQKSKQVLKQKSYGMKITGDRIKMFNELHNVKASCHIEDLTDADGRPTGTRVTLLLPFEVPVTNP